MPKRKRDYPDESASASPATVRTGQTASSSLSKAQISPTQLSTRIEQGVAQLRKALILARGFERQKLGRRQKAANNQPQQLLKLREEVIVLKQLDLGIVAERQFLKRLARVKRIAENETFQAVSRDTHGSRGSSMGEAEGNVVGRLMSSNPAKECLPGLMESVLQVLGLEKTRKDYHQTNPADGNEVLLPVRAPVNELIREDGDEWSGSESDGEMEDAMFSDRDSKMENGSDEQYAKEQYQDPDLNMSDSSEFSGFSSRIATQSEAEAESGDSEPDSPGSFKDRNSLTISNQQPLLLATSPPTQPDTKSKPNATKTKNSIPTPFVPSLMMSGYYSGSDSERGSDLDDPVHNTGSGGGGGGVKSRKNRRGQRARQKIAEAKFGAGAKHLADLDQNQNHHQQQQQQQQTGGRNVGWDPKRGAVDGKSRFVKGEKKGRGPGGAGGGRGVKGPTGANGDVLGTRDRRKDKKKGSSADGPMHPSWEAARKIKEQQVGGGKISIDPRKVVGAGKKITFD